jgi:(p)ppGpp synthase/HD superfamily hydrolase
VKIYPKNLERSSGTGKWVRTQETGMERDDQILFEAIEFAARAHSGQFRKGTRIPYIIHPFNVARILIEYGCKEEVVVAGFLHDTVEDTPVTLDEIEQSFGKEVAALVQGASEPRHATDTWEHRKEHTIEYLKTAPEDILLVASADKLDNILSIKVEYAKIGESAFSRFNRGKDQQRWYYQSLAEVFLSRTEGEPGNSLFREFSKEVKKVFGRD